MTRMVLIGGDPQLVSDYFEAARRLRGVSLTAVESAESPPAALADETDAVLLLGPIPYRVEIARQAARAGKHVLVPSPLALTVAEAEAIVSDCERAKVQLMIGDSARFRPSNATAKAALETGKLGSPAFVRIHAWETFQGFEFDSWPRLTEQLDLAAWLFDQRPTSVFALASENTRKAPWSDYVQVHLGFPDGGMALLTISKTLPAGATYDAVTVIATAGATYSDDHTQTQLLFKGGPPTGLKTTEGVTALTAQLREFVTAIARNRVPSVNGHDAIAALKLTDAVRKSLELKQAIQLSEGALAHA